MKDKMLVKVFKWFFALSLVIVIMCSPNLRLKVSNFYHEMKGFVFEVFGEGEEAQDDIEEPEKVFDFNKRTITVNGN